MKSELEKKVKHIEKEFSRYLEYYIKDDVLDVHVVCDIYLTLDKPAESIVIDLKVDEY